MTSHLTSLESLDDYYQLSVSITEDRLIKLVTPEVRPWIRLAKAFIVQTSKVQPIITTLYRRFDRCYNPRSPVNYSNDLNCWIENETAFCSSIYCINGFIRMDFTIFFPHFPTIFAYFCDDFANGKCSCNVNCDAQRASRLRN